MTRAPRLADHPAMRGARLLHTLLVVGVVVAMAVLGVARQILDGGVIPNAPLALRVVPFVLAAGLLGVRWVVRSRIPMRRDADDEGAWLEVYRAKILLAAFLADAAAMVGATFWFVTGETLVLIGAAGPGLMALLLSRPRPDDAP